MKRTKTASPRVRTFETKKSLGQHFLNNTRIPERMADAGDVKPGDTILEIGPGTGALTKILLARGATVIALEADARAITVLSKTYEMYVVAQKLIIIHTDVRTLDLTTIHPLIRDHAYKVIANIPYYLSGHLFRVFLETSVQPTHLVFLVQREVAERIARDTKESLLSLSVKAYGTPRYIETVKRGNFTPPPKVDSAIIAIHDISRARFSAISESSFFTLLHAGFASKRKQLIGNLSQTYSREILHTLTNTLHIRPDVRGEDLDIDTWFAIAAHLN